MTTKSTEELEQGVLSASLALAGQQQKDLEAIRRLKTGMESLESATAELDQAELELAEADLAYARAKHRALECSREQTEQRPAWLAAFHACEEARKALWAVASSGDEARILQTAREVGDKMRVLGQLGQDKHRLDKAVRDAQDDQKLAGEARKSSVQRRGKAKAAHEAALVELEEACHYDRRTELFALQVALVSAALELSGTVGQDYAFSNVETEGLYQVRRSAAYFLHRW